MNAITHAAHPLQACLSIGTVVLMYKNGSAMKAESYRPVAQAIVLAKIASSIYCSRLKQMLQKSILCAQTCFVSDRTITKDIIMIHDTMQWCKSHCPKAARLSLYFAKAYDRVPWCFFFKTVLNVGFCLVLQKFVTSLYGKSTTVLAINCRIIEPFAVSRRVQQGDPISQFLFIIQMIPLCNMTESARPAHGIWLSPTITLPADSSFADDSLLLAHSPSTAISLYKIALAYCLSSGARLHPGKCVAIPAKLTDTQVYSNEIKRISAGQATMVLGIPIGCGMSRKQCIQKVVRLMQHRCYQLNNRTLTIQERVAVTTYLIMSTLRYVLSVLAFQKNLTEL